MKRTCSGRRKIGHPDGSEVLFEEFATPRNVRLRVLCAIAMLRVVAMSDVATIMIQGANDGEAEQTLVDDTAFDRSDATVCQPRHRERHVENVLDIVIRRVAR